MVRENEAQPSYRIDLIIMILQLKAISFVKFQSKFGTSSTLLFFELKTTLDS